MGLRETKKQRQRQQLIECAIALFRERGYDQTRVQDIIERAEVSEATFFNYFATKDAVLEAFALDRVKRYGDLLKAALQASGRPLAERLRDLLRAMALGFSDDREFMAVVATRSKLFFGARDAMLHKELLTYELLGRLFREGQERGEVRADVDANQIAEIFTGVYTLTLINWLTGWRDDASPLDERLMTAAGVFIDGIRPNTRKRRRR
jgi:AcrR family transcriptional regulator